MPEVALPAGAARFRWLALAASVCTYLLIVAGGIVRVTGSGLACPDWPLCHGQIIPPFSVPVLIEWTHRLLASLTTPLIMATAWFAWRHHRQDRRLVQLALLAVALLALQIGLGAVTVLLELPPVVVAVHLANALIILAILLAVTVAAFCKHADPREDDWVALPDGFSRLTRSATLGVLALMVTGSLVTGTRAGFACIGWPACGGEWLPSSALGVLHMTHRYMAAGVGIAVLASVALAWRARPAQTPVLVAGTVVGSLFLGQVLVGAMNVLRGFPTFLNGLHLATAAAVWGSMVVFSQLATYWGRRSPQTRPDAQPAPTPSEATPWAALADYLALTKPIITLLLLTTTYTAMVVAEGGFPPAWLTFWTMLGGAMASGGSSAINQVIDRDLDQLMSRTSRRPLPSGRLDTARALSFGVFLCVASFFVLAVFVNAVAALLALTGILYYVIGYSLMLKRTTVQNIVIGGGAGAIPPLVGWAAVAGHLSMPAMFLFAIIFFWTPPHFWALALLKRQDYARANVPMLPVVWGEAETRRHIFLYSLLVVALSLLLTPARVAGMLFLVCATVLGAVFLGYSLLLWRGGGNRLAWGMYKYSSLYLALLFAALVVDSVVR